MLTCPTNLSVPNFVKLFDFLLQLVTDTHEVNTLEQVETNLSKAVDAYHSHFTTEKWHVSSKSSGFFNVVCWNCGKEGCSVNRCL